MPKKRDAVEEMEEKEERGEKGRGRDGEVQTAVAP